MCTIHKPLARIFELFDIFFIVEEERTISKTPIFFKKQAAGKKFTTVFRPDPSSFTSVRAVYE